MQYCSTQGCYPGVFVSSTNFCSTCGQETTPCIRCLTEDCPGEFNPKRKLSYCYGCGAHLSPAFLGRCMAAQLQGMITTISQQLSEQVVGSSLSALSPLQNNRP